MLGKRLGALLLGELKLYLRIVAPFVHSSLELSQRTLVGRLKRASSARSVPLGTGYVKTHTGRRVKQIETHSPPSQARNDAELIEDGNQESKDCYHGFSRRR